MTTMISMGPPFTMASGVIYALPAVEVKAYVQVMSGTGIELSNDGITFGPTIPAATVSGQYDLAATFIRSVGGSCIISLKRD